MNTSNRIVIRSAFAPMFERAADISRWPEILPHYRYVNVLERRNGEVVAEMAARHYGYPLWWRTIQIPLPDEKRIVFKHIGGITKGMDVEWTFEEQQTAKIEIREPKLTADESRISNIDSRRLPLTWLVQIHHHFNPDWMFPGRWFANRIIGEIFVKQVADKTLRRMKQIAES